MSALSPLGKPSRVAKERAISARRPRKNYSPLHEGEPSNSVLGCLAIQHWPNSGLCRRDSLVVVHAWANFNLRHYPTNRNITRTFLDFNPLRVYVYRPLG